MLGAIPFEMPNGIPLILVEARLGDTPARLLLDTGAAAPFPLLISPGFAARSGAALDAGRDADRIGGVGDATISIRPAHVARLRVGPVTLTNAGVGVTDALEAVSRQLGTNIDGILGHPFIAGRRIAIDYVRRTVDLAAAAGPETAAIPFTLAPLRPLTLVRATIHGHGPFLMALDTGANTTLLAPATAAAAGVEAGQAARIGGAGGTASGGARVGRANIRLGGLTRDGQTVAVADVLGQARAQSGAPIDGVLGADFFRTNRIVIDYGGNRLWIEEGAAGG